MTTATIDRDRQLAKARAANAKAARTRYYVKYTQCERMVTLGRRLTRFNWETEETVQLGPFRRQKQAEAVILETLIYPNCVPGTAEIVEVEV